MEDVQSQGGKTIEDEVLCVEGDNYKATQKTGTIQLGDRIEAKVNDQNHALSIQGIVLSD